MLRLDELIGQEEARRQLEELAGSGRLPHAMLFVGPVGVGKFTAAQALAQALLCKMPIAPTQACLECSSCVKFETAVHADYQHVTTTTRNIKIRDIREAEHRLRLRPVEGRAKALLIEDADRMTIEAQNALLKTLEEPPGESYIILTTARLRSILPTVVSRSQRVRFRPIPRSALHALIVEHRDVPLSRAALIGALAQGSIGDALELEIEPFLEARNRVAELDANLESATAKAALVAIEGGSALGQDRAELVRSLDLLALWLHDQLIIASGSTQMIANEDRREDITALAERRGVARILRRADDVIEARRHVSAPNNLNATMIAEQLCLSLAGHTRIRKLPAA